jgi:hypothetical protein
LEGTKTSPTEVSWGGNQAATIANALLIFQERYFVRSFFLIKKNEKIKAQRLLTLS